MIGRGGEMEIAETGLGPGRGARTVMLVAAAADLGILVAPLALATGALGILGVRGAQVVSLPLMLLEGMCRGQRNQALLLALAMTSRTRKRLRMHLQLKG
jgi:hypothetical protein